MTSIRQAAGRCMDLVRLEDAVERPKVFSKGIVVVSEAGGVVIPGRRDREQMCHRLSGGRKTRIHIHRGTCSESGTLLVGLTEILPDGEREIRFLQRFLLPSQQQLLLPATFFPPCTTSQAVGQQNRWNIDLRGPEFRRQLFFRRRAELENSWLRAGPLSSIGARQ
jgi:hypothetical protein